jgi:hypothetical protein
LFQLVSQLGDYLGLVPFGQKMQRTIEHGNERTNSKKRDSAASYAAFVARIDG